MAILEHFAFSFPLWLLEISQAASPKCAPAIQWHNLDWIRVRWVECKTDSSRVHAQQDRPVYDNRSTWSLQTLWVMENRVQQNRITLPQPRAFFRISFLFILFVFLSYFGANTFCVHFKSQFLIYSWSRENSHIKPLRSSTDWTQLGSRWTSKPSIDTSPWAKASWCICSIAQFIPSNCPYSTKVYISVSAFLTWHYI